MAFDEHLRYYYPSTEASIDPYVAKKKTFQQEVRHFLPFPNERDVCMVDGPQEMTIGADWANTHTQHNNLFPFFEHH